MTAATHLEPIPHPPGHKFIGNLFDLDTSHPIDSLTKLAQEYGPIYRLEMPGGKSRVVVTGLDLVDELCDDSRFDKALGPGLQAVHESRLVGGGLFSAWTYEPEWKRAHNILLPAFSLDAMRGYMPKMLDLADQLVLKWGRLNADDTVDVPDDMTRLTLDTIALCGFNYRFNSFYRETSHPFVAAMVRLLVQVQESAGKPAIALKLDRKALRQQRRDEDFMNETVQRILQERRDSGEAGTVNDLLDRMLTGVDRQSGGKLDDRNIISQCITFLIAGHETTSSLLSFAIYELLKHPAVMERAYAEVDRVLGTDPSVLPTYAQVHQLAYITQILDESLRLWPPAPVFSRYPYEDTVIGGKYMLEKGTGVSILPAMLHRDRRVWGDNAEEFDPDHFSPENQAKLPPNAFKPFGTGERACIGRQFAMQEAALVLGMVLQRYELIDYANYELKLREALSVKPDAFHIKVKPRAGRTSTVIPARPQPESAPATAAPATPTAAATPDGHHTPLLVLYGSNLGTAEGIAHGVAEDATKRGFVATVGALDDHAGSLPTEGGVVIVTASYNGKAPDNAAKFCQWLQDPVLPADAFAGVEYTVFGCGNRDWSSTYQVIPKLIDEQLEKHGAKRMYGRGEGDARGDFDSEYRAWYTPLWESVASELSLPDSVAESAPAGPRFSVAFVNRQAANPVITSYSAVPMTLRDNRELQNTASERPSERSTRHIEFTLPAGVTYNAGDHLGVVPRNGVELFRRVLLHYKLDPSLYVRITPSANVTTHLPVHEPVPLIELLANRVELQDVATRPQIATLAGYTEDPDQRDALLAMAGDDDESQARYRDQVLQTRRSILDLLDQFPACRLPFDAYLEMLPPLRPRYYSISSSSLVAPDTCSITVGVVEGPARSGSGEYNGVASNYLRAQTVDSMVFGFVHKPTIPFQPPANPHTPMIMVGPGTGVAPFRGFLQERAALKQRGVPVGESLLFFGCRDPLQDYIYEDEMRVFEAAGVTRLQTACSRVPGQPKVYVQQLITEQSAEVWRLLQQEAVIFVCGDASRMAPDVRRAFADVFRGQTGASDADAQAWLAGLAATNRYLEDIWAGGGA